MMRARMAVPTGGETLGFEPRCMNDWDPSCSWHCNALVPQFVRRTGLKPNAHGLIDDHAAALAFCRAITREGLAEPGTWQPWLVTDYTPHG